MRSHREVTALPRELRLLILARCVNRLGGFSMAFLGVLLVRSRNRKIRSSAWSRNASQRAPMSS